MMNVKKYIYKILKVFLISSLYLSFDSDLDFVLDIFDTEENITELFSSPKQNTFNKKDLFYKKSSFITKENVSTNNNFVSEYFPDCKNSIFSFNFFDDKTLKTGYHDVHDLLNQLKLSTFLRGPPTVS
jgi:hypothetical protein